MDNRALDVTWEIPRYHAQAGFDDIVYIFVHINPILGEYYRPLCPGDPEAGNWTAMAAMDVCPGYRALLSKSPC